MEVPHPLPTLALCISSPWLFPVTSLYNKPAHVAKGFPLTSVSHSEMIKPKEGVVGTSSPLPTGQKHVRLTDLCLAAEVGRGAGCRTEPFTCGF